MPTNDERISAAMALRLFAESDNPEILKPRMAIWIIGIHVGVKGSVTPWSLAARLAELIEPEERTCRMHRDERGTWHCDNCDDSYRNGEGIVPWYDSWEPDFCPDCGARVVHDA